MSWMKRTRATAGGAATLAALLLLTGCSGSGGGASYEGGSIKPASNLEGKDITVGSKEFDEQLVLAQIAIVALEASGATVKDQTGLQGTGTVRKALTSGDIDLYWEYSGTAWFEFLGQSEALPGPEMYDKVAALDLAENDVTWLTAAPMNDTYAVGVTQEFAKKTGIKTVSDMAEYVAKNPKDATMCVENEFLQRPDGLAGMKTAYGIGDVETKLMGASVVYTQLAGGKDCNFGDIYSTDGRIVSLDLLALEDDKGFFPNYAPAVTMLKETSETYPEIKEVMDPITAKIDNETITRLNAEAADGTKPKKIAEEWLRSEGFIG